MAKKALGYIDELGREKDFASEAKSSGAWLECLNGRVLMLEAATHDEGKALITRGIDALKNEGEADSRGHAESECNRSAPHFRYRLAQGSP